MIFLERFDQRFLLQLNCLQRILSQITEKVQKKVRFFERWRAEICQKAEF